MADLTKFTINEAELARIAGEAGPLGQHVNGLADRVVNQAIQNATGRPGPRIRTGDLIESIEKLPDRDANGYFVDVSATAEHRGYPYPSRLETGQDGHYYPFLKPALDEVFGSQ